MRGGVRDRPPTSPGPHFTRPDLARDGVPRRPRARDRAAVFAELHLRQPRSTAIDVDTLLRAVDGDGDAAEGVLPPLTEAICGVISALVALTDPQVVLIG